jgi:hypothetical protein
MATDNKSSILVDELLPEFLETEGPKFKAFVRAYYEFLETTGQITERSKNLFNYADIDKTEAEFVKHFDREILADFPQEILANRSLVAARIKELYRAKGSQQAYKMLFRMLFDDEIEFYYPGEDILRVSDGRWVQETSIRLSAPFVGNLFNIGGRNIVGLTSGATAIVERVVKTFEQGVEVFELFLGNVRGSFQDTEIVETPDSSLRGIVLSSIGPLTGVIVNFGGSSHRVQDRVSFLSNSGVGGQGVVLEVDDSSIIPLIINGGSGFTVNSIVTITGGSGSGAAFKVDSISNTEVLFTYDDVIFGIANTSIEANTFGSSNTTTISANLAIADANTTIGAALGTSSLTVGTISAMSAITRGSGYTSTQLPTVQVIEQGIAEQFLDDGSGGIKGFNANVIATNIGGSIVSVSVDRIGAGYARIDPLTITNLSRNAQNASGSPLVTGVINYDGKYTDTKGFISWNNRLQDNFYYQQFSYVLKSSRLVNTYREIVKKLIHPAGTNLFGDFLIRSNISFPTPQTIEDVNIPLTSSFGTPELVFVIDPNAVASTAIVSGIDQLARTIEHDLSIGSTATVSNPLFLTAISNVNVPSTLSFGVPSFVFIIVDPSSIASTAVVSNTNQLGRTIEYDTSTVSTAIVSNPLLQITIDDVNATSAPSFGIAQLGYVVGSDSISSTAIVSGIDQLARTIEYDASIASTTAISNVELQLVISDINTASSLNFGTSELVFILDAISVESTVVVANNHSVIPVYDIQSISSTATVSNALLQITINDVNIPSSLNFGTTEFVFVIDTNAVPSTDIVSSTNQLARTIEYDASIASTTAISNPLFQITIDDVSDDDNDNVNIPSSLRFGTAELIFIVDPNTVPSAIVVANNSSVIPVYDIQSISSTVVISNPLFQITIDDVSDDDNDNVNIPSTLSFGTAELIFIVDPNTVPSTIVIANNHSVIPVYDIQSISSTATVSNPSLQITIDDVNATSAASFGTTELIFIIDTNAIPSTAIVSGIDQLARTVEQDVPIISTAVVFNPLLQITIDNINIPSSTSVAVPGAFQLGNGTITNVLVNTIGDLSTQQIAKYGNLTINSVPGNRIFDGINTTFTTQLFSGSSIVVIDINGTNEQIPLIVSSISGNTALSVTSNVLYSNSSLAIVNNAIYLYS